MAQLQGDDRHGRGRRECRRWSVHLALSTNQDTIFSVCNFTFRQGSAVREVLINAIVLSTSSSDHSLWGYKKHKIRDAGVSRSLSCSWFPAHVNAIGMPFFARGLPGQISVLGLKKTTTTTDLKSNELWTRLHRRNFDPKRGSKLLAKSSETVRGKFLIFAGQSKQCKARIIAPRKVGLWGQNRNRGILWRA